MDINMINKDKRGITILGLGPGKPEKDYTGSMGNIKINSKIIFKMQT